MNQMMIEEIRSIRLEELIDLFAEEERKIEELEEYADVLKAEVINRVASVFDDSKSKQHKFKGFDSVLTLTKRDTVNLVSYEFLKKVFKGATKDFAKPEIKYKLTDEIKDVLGALNLGNYTKKTLLETLQELGIPEGFHNVMTKKLKGKPDKDKEFLMSQLGIPEGEAETAAYFIREAIIWEKLKKILDACDVKDVEKAIDVLSAAVSVNESLAVSVEKIS